MGFLEFFQLYIFTFEFLSVIAGLLYLTLIIKEVKWAWPLAFVSSSAMLLTAFNAKLYMEMILQAYYVIMAVVGWFSWTNKRKNKEKTYIKIWTFKFHIINICLSFALTFLFGFFMQTYTDQALPFMDSFTTIFSLTTTIMVTQKVLENWLYWVIINAINVGMMYNRELYWASGLMVLYTFMAVQGYFRWKKAYQLQDETN